MAGEYGDFWREAEAMKDYTAQAEREMSGLHQARKDALLRKAGEGRSRIMGGLSSRGLGASYSRGGVGAGTIRSFDEAAAEELGELESQYRSDLLDLQYERDTALRDLLRSSKEADKLKKPGLYDILGTGVDFFTGGFGKNLLSSIF